MHRKGNQANIADMQRLKMELPVWVSMSFSVLFSPLPQDLCTHISFHVTKGRKDSDTRLPIFPSALTVSK